MKDCVNDSRYMIDGNTNTLTNTFLKPNIHQPTERLFISITVLLSSLAEVSRVDVYSVPTDRDSSMWDFVVRTEVGSTVRLCGIIKSMESLVQLNCDSPCRGDKIIFEKWFDDNDNDGVSLSVAEIIVYGRTFKKRTSRELSPEVVTLVIIGGVMVLFFVTVQLSNMSGKRQETKEERGEEDQQDTFEIDLTEDAEDLAERNYETNGEDWSGEQIEMTEIRASLREHTGIIQDGESPIQQRREVYDKEEPSGGQFYRTKENI